MLLSRRNFLISAAALASPHAHASVEFAEVYPRPLTFPRDHGAHPDYRTEWWYLTGWLDRPRAATSIGFQITLFRARTSIDPANPSAFAAKQLVIAHAAIADPARGRLLRDERLARTGFGAASAATDDTDLLLDRWRLVRSPQDGSYRAFIPARSFTLELEAKPTQPLLLQGDAGYSRKAAAAMQSSHYYSQPQLSVNARLLDNGGAKAEQLTGTGWLDHEWSSTLLSDDAAGWDWLGCNLDDGSALTAFSIRGRLANSAPLYAYASLRTRGGTVQTFGSRDVAFSTIGEWTSPRTRATWPIARQVRIGDRSFTTQPLMEDQELDSRATTGAVYWEGASRLFEADRSVGRGYLEMTGYVAPLRL
ncbi:MAG: lipocalin-like domain-containing protein [Burkholderiaceae bacterium]